MVTNLINVIPNYQSAGSLRNAPSFELVLRYLSYDGRITFKLEQKMSTWVVGCETFGGVCAPSPEPTLSRLGTLTGRSTLYGNSQFRKAVELLGECALASA